MTARRPNYLQKSLQIDKIRPGSDSISEAWDGLSPISPSQEYSRLGGTDTKWTSNNASAIGGMQV